nr:hypothetical protein [Tanacetum cinerariifolium]
RTQKDTKLPQTSVSLNLGADEAIHKDGVTVWKGGMDTGGSPRCQETIGGTPAQTRSKRVLEQPNKQPLSEGHTSRSREGRMEHTFELIDIVPPTPHDSPLIGGYTPGKDEAFITLTKRVKKLETQLKQKRSRAVIHSSDEEEPSLDIEDSPKQGRMIGEIDKDENINIVSEQAELDQREEDIDKGDQTQDIDWNDPEVLRYHALQNRVFSKIEKQKLDEQTEEEIKAQADTDQEVEEMKLYVKIVPDEDITIDAIPLATKPPVIVEYKIVKEGKISTYHIIRADGSTK